MIQKLINKLYRHPKSWLKTYRRFGGYINYQKMLSSRRQMEQESLNLPPVVSEKGGWPVHFLTGKNYLYQTLFCIQSLAIASAEQFQFVLIDDGSFDDRLIQRINIQLPGATIVTEGEISENIQRLLPPEQYPNLHTKRKVYPHIKKLTDVHTLPENTWKLVLDSDMLFWHNPAEMIRWLQSPDQPLYMVDCQNSYGYSRKLMESLCGSSVKDLLNVGMIGLNSKLVDWESIEKWIPLLEQQEGTSYYLEQALTAMLIGDSASARLDQSTYIVNPSERHIKNKEGVLHHYVDTSKAGYFNLAWKQVKQ